MKEHSILFAGSMVRAILDGRKSQTRRVAKVWLWQEDSQGGGTYPVDGMGDRIECPYGVIGDRLWVRETFSVHQDDQDVVCYRATDHADCGPWKPSIFMLRKFSRITLEITEVRLQRLQDITEEDAIAEGIERNCDPDAPEKWEESDGWMPHDHPANIDGPPVFYPVREWYQPLWDSINEKRGHGWDTNPWVWAITFKRVEVPE